MRLKNAHHLLLMLLLFAQCIQIGEEEEVIITREYVINPNWDKDDNSLGITRLKLKEPGHNIDLSHTSQRELMTSLEEDRKFSYTSNITYNGESYGERKVYFNNYNGFKWWKWSPTTVGKLELDRSYETIGELKKDNWYSFGGLSRFGTVYYVYIDSVGNVHRFSIMAPNW